MSQTKEYDAVVVGSGPNGLAAAITLQRQGLSVIILEAKATTGGGMRTAELTLPGFHHDICSAIHPMGAASPFFNSLPLQKFGLEWINPPIAVAHPFDNGTAAILEQSIADSARTLGKEEDAKVYQRLMNKLQTHCKDLIPDLLGPLSIPSYPIPFTYFGLQAMQSAVGFAKRNFKGEQAKALFAGLAAHSLLPLEYIFSNAIGLVLGMVGHWRGWPLPRGGSQQIARALEAYFLSLGGKVMVNHPVNSIKDIPSAKAILFDITPRQLLSILGQKLPSLYRKQLQGYHYGPGVFKMDFALNSPIPFKASDCHRTATLHLGGTMEEIAFSERAPWAGKHIEKPFVLLAQQSLFDSSRAPEGKHTAWAYCHVPNGSIVDMSTPIENQIERFAPGFRDCILEKHVFSAQGMEQYNANYIGGDINGGAANWTQLFTRPVVRLSPYSIPLKGMYICSASTPPGGGVHGMCGYHAAKKALQEVFNMKIGNL